jgi:hypothetical protein
VPPRGIVRPPSSDRLLKARVELARIAMLCPARRAWAAYLAQLCGGAYWLRRRRRGLLGTLAARARRPASGLCWTVLALGSGAAEVIRAGHRRAPAFEDA